MLGRVKKHFVWWNVFNCEMGKREREKNVADRLFMKKTLEKPLTFVRTDYGWNLLGPLDICGVF